MLSSVRAGYRNRAVVCAHHADAVVGKSAFLPVKDCAVTLTVPLITTDCDVNPRQETSHSQHFTGKYL